MCEETPVCVRQVSDESICWDKIDDIDETLDMDKTGHMDKI